MKSVIILHHHEITLKGQNRRMFEMQLLKNCKQTVSGLLQRWQFSGGYGRFVVELSDSDEQNKTEIIERLRKVFGLSNLCVGLAVRNGIENYCSVAVELLKGKTFQTLRVDTHRASKMFPINSMEINRKVGGYLCEKFNVRAKMVQPDVTIFIEVLEDEAYIYSEKIPCAGGLPSGMSGKVISLISAGFDSPISSYQIMKRGAKVFFVHFHSVPYTTQNSIQQVENLVNVLTQYQFESTLFLVPFAELQQQIVLSADQKLRIVLYRRFMIRIAEKLARREKAQALVTGESLGQVASQTLRNISVIDEVATMPILRPLIGTDKEDIMHFAAKIGTYDISKEPYDDCCSFLAPRAPETWAKLEEVLEAEKNLDVEKLVRECLEKVEVKKFSYP
ncbi:MAG: tRNA 4-thiouridine(8) synthase ThiI [Ignavibacteriales bacterium]|nr:tRNA 4-thiouridine(8) synthase ThiI [Ignavibacteriales bacterium]